MCCVGTLKSMSRVTRVARQTPSYRKTQDCSSSSVKPVGPGALLPASSLVSRLSPARELLSVQRLHKVLVNSENQFVNETGIHADISCYAPFLYIFKTNIFLLGALTISTKVYNNCAIFLLIRYRLP